MNKFFSLAVLALLGTSQAIQIDKKSASQSFYVLVEEPVTGKVDGDSMSKKDEALTQESSEVNTDEEPAKVEATGETKADKKGKPFKAEANDNDVVPFKP